VAGPETSAPTAAPAGRTLADATIIDRTIVDAPRPAPAPSPARPAPAWRGFWEQWARRQWWVGGVSAGACLVIILVWALVRGHAKPAPTPQAPAPPPSSVAPAPVALDDLGPMTPDSTPGLADAAQLVRLGLRDQAITVLQDIRGHYPRSAYASYLLAVVYFEKLWWSIGLQHAQAAIQNDPAYRRSPRLAKLLVHSLISDGFWEKGAAFLKQEMAEVATPYLEEAAKSDKSPRVRVRAAQVLGIEPER
jgi:hypothetical protein